MEWRKEAKFGFIKHQIQMTFVIHTVKLGYNDHGYNKFTAITYKIYCFFGPIWLIYNTNLHCYNDATVRLYSQAQGTSIFYNIM